MGSQFEFSYKPPGWYRLASYDFLLWALSIVFDCFFREIRPRGAFKIPHEGPVIFVAAPHHNQFVDPIILMNQVKREANRRISFLIAAKSYKLKMVGSMAKCQLSIPVVRPQDNLVKGLGKIFVDPKDPCHIIGKGTKFTEECMVRGLIALPQSLGATEIAEIISDTELIIRKEFKQSDKVQHLLTIGTSYKKADKIDQKNVYKMVFDHLSHNNCLGIFPEGGSHDRPDLLPLKAGVAVMALGAMEKYSNCNVTIVPCGMNYFSAHKFRSRAVVEFGDPIVISKDLVKKYSNHETSKEAVRELLDLISTGLKAVTVTCEDYETLMLIQAARRLYAGNFAQQLPLPLIVEMNRRLVNGYQHYKDQPVIKELKKKVLKYNELLKSLHLPDHHVEDCQEEVNKVKLIPILILRVLKLVFLFTLALPGATLFAPVFASSKFISKKKAKEALANSEVKIEANDVLATWKILVAMGIAPIVYSFYASVGTYYCFTHDILSSFKLFWLWVFLYVCGVLVTYSALLIGEQGVDLLKSIRPLYLSISSGSSIRQLKKMRKELSEEITEVVNTYGPELYPTDFNLLELKNSLKISDDVKYIPSDEEEDRKTEELKYRRRLRRKAERKSNMDVSSEETAISNSSSMSDVMSLLTSDPKSYTNLPIFSDYHLHKNVNNPNLDLDPQSKDSSSVSLYEDSKKCAQNNHYQQQQQQQQHSYISSPLRGRSSEEHIELNFSNETRLRNKIKDKVRQNRKV
ncbi:SCT1 [Candida oxycetoniae]|uniref:SCT1 n=1 Tax=Candida oxycetoniae TaxID=497107 RepID=A0AAI9WXN7_9ASCO|nr:SCT1 [Candida oxycetoniae]KAI3403960.2 SCT1 [Candida oxycetoniae]